MGAAILPLISVVGSVAAAAVPLLVADKQADIPPAPIPQAPPPIPQALPTDGTDTGTGEPIGEPAVEPEAAVDLDVAKQRAIVRRKSRQTDRLLTLKTDESALKRKTLLGE